MATLPVELRQGLWAFIRRLNRDGHTIVLTTHYLEEAESLCGRIAMLKQGRIVALDTTRNLLRRFSGHTLRLRLAPGHVLPDTLRARASAEAEGSRLFNLANCDEIEGILAGLRPRPLAVYLEEQRRVRRYPSKYYRNHVFFIYLLKSRRRKSGV